MASETGYRITITAWLPVDPDNIAELISAMGAIQSLRDPSEVDDITMAACYRMLHELNIKHRLVPRRATAPDNAAVEVLGTEEVAE